VLLVASAFLTLKLACRCMVLATLADTLLLSLVNSCSRSSNTWNALTNEPRVPMSVCMSKRESEGVVSRSTLFELLLAGLPFLKCYLTFIVGRVIDRVILAVTLLAALVFQVQRGIVVCF